MIIIVDGRTEHVAHVCRITIIFFFKSNFKFYTALDISNALNISDNLIHFTSVHQNHGYAIFLSYVRP